MDLLVAPRFLRSDNQLVALLVGLHSFFGEEKVDGVSFAYKFLDVVEVNGFQVGHAGGEVLAEGRDEFHLRAKIHKGFQLVTGVVVGSVVDQMLDIVGEQRKHEFKLSRVDQFRRLNYMDDTIGDRLRVLHVALEDLMIDYLVDSRERVIVQNQHIWRGNVRLFHLLQKHLPSIHHQLPIFHQLRNSRPLYPQSLQFVIQYFTGKGIGSDDKIGDLLSFRLYHKGSYLYFLILEKLAVDIEELQSVVLLILGNLGIDVLIDIIENIGKVLLLAHRLNLLVVADALPAPPRPAAV